jgi:pyruvate/2-oxoglutarate dehydrogenase complex dihydrolipoamide acyltransferase (E2) component
MTHLLAPAENGRVLSPLVRRYARDRGIDPATVRGTGIGGRIRRPDIDAAVRGKAPATPGTPPSTRQPAAPPTTPRPSAGGPADGFYVAPPTTPRPSAGGPADRQAAAVPLTGMRAVIAARMHASLHEMAQLTLGYEVRLDAVCAARDQLKRELAGGGGSAPSLNDFVIRAAALALREHPALNATARADGVVRHPAVHVGIAVAVPDGLLVPVLRDATDGPLLALAARTRALANAARNGKLRLPELEGATFAVTSLSGYGVDFFTPVVLPGNVAILGVGQLRDGIAWTHETPRRSRALTLSLTFDHRAVDGAPAAEYLKTVSHLLQSPQRLLAG